VVGGWRRLHNEELHNLHVSPSTIRVTDSEYEIDRTGNMHGRD
jgi:hypothetical protein